MMKDKEILIKVEGVSKKFCKNLKKSLWYGAQDIFFSVFGVDSSSAQLRKDEFWAVRDVSFQVKRGECLGLIGHNGAGKSTLLKMLNGLIRPDEGRIEMRGKIGALIELGAGFNPILTGRENVYNNGAVLGFSKSDIDRKFDDIVAFAEIEEFIDMPVQNYSSGMKVRLGFAVASQMEPDILLLDEVLAVGDASFRIKCFNHIHKIISKCAVIFVSHSLPQITRICDRAIYLETGQVKMIGEELSQIIKEYVKELTQELISNNDIDSSFNVFHFNCKDNVTEKVNELFFGNPFSFTFKLKSGEINEELNYSVQITINDALENNVAQITENIEIKSDAVNFVELNFPSCDFNTGKYFITLSVLEGKKGKFKSVNRNIGSFVTENPFPGYAAIFLKPVIKIKNEY